MRTSLRPTISTCAGVRSGKGSASLIFGAVRLGSIFDDLKITGRLCRGRIVGPADEHCRGDRPQSALTNLARCRVDGIRPASAECIMVRYQRPAFMAGKASQAFPGKPLQGFPEGL